MDFLTEYLRFFLVPTSSSNAINTAWVFSAWMGVLPLLMIFFPIYYFQKQLIKFLMPTIIILLIIAVFKIDQLSDEVMRLNYRCIERFK